MNEQNALTEWLVDYLSSDSELTNLTNGDVSPEVRWGTNPSPFVRVDYLDGEDVYVIGLHRVWLDAIYHVRGVEHWRGSGQPDRSTVNAIGDRIDVLLHKHEAITDTLSVHSFQEEPTPEPAVKEPNGELWLASGGIYRIRGHAVV